jgi:hypothetical protein
MTQTASNAASIFGDALSTGMSGAGAQGATGLLSKLSGILGSASSWMPVIGPLISAFGPMLLKGLASLGGKIWGGIKSLFGGPSAAELEGREAAAAYVDSVRAGLSADDLAQIKLKFPQDFEMASFLAGIQQQLIAAGVAAEEASVQAQQWGTKLWEAEKQGAGAVQSVIDQIAAATAVTTTAATTASTSAASIQTSYEKALAAVAAAQAALTAAMGTAGETQAQQALDAATRVADTWAAKLAEIAAGADATATAFGVTFSGTVDAAAVAADSVKTSYETALAAVETAQQALTAAVSQEEKARAEMALQAATDTAASWAQKLAEIASGSASTTMQMGDQWASAKDSITTTLDDVALEGGAALRRLADESGRAARAASDQWDRFRPGFDFPSSAQSPDRDNGGIPSFASGGTVPGPIGQPRLIMAHGGETVTPPGRGGSNQPIVIQIRMQDDRLLTEVVLRNSPEVARALGIGGVS